MFNRDDEKNNKLRKNNAVDSAMPDALCGLRKQQTNTQIKSFAEPLWSALIVLFGRWTARAVPHRAHSLENHLDRMSSRGTAEAWRKTPSRIYEYIFIFISCRGKNKREFYLKKKKKSCAADVAASRDAPPATCYMICTKRNETRSKTKQNCGLVAGDAWVSIFHHVSLLPSHCMTNKRKWKKKQRYRTAHENSQHEMIKMSDSK